MEAASTLTNASSGMTVISDQGSGRAFVVMFDSSDYDELACGVGRAVAERNRGVVLKSESVTADSWMRLSEGLAHTVRELGVRQAGFVCFGAAATLVQNVALEEPKAVRTIVMVDATSRPHPSRWERAVDKIEESLPFGLPLRLGSRGFNVRSYLHRLRCPMLVVTTGRASSFERDEGAVMSANAPTSWLVDVSETGPRDELLRLAEMILSFQDTPVKCPQKNLKEQR